jgi:hypothetical protein
MAVIVDALAAVDVRNRPQIAAAICVSGLNQSMLNQIRERRVSSQINSVGS